PRSHRTATFCATSEPQIDQCSQRFRLQSALPSDAKPHLAPTLQPSPGIHESPRVAAEKAQRSSSRSPAVEQFRPAYRVIRAPSSHSPEASKGYKGRSFLLYSCHAAAQMPDSISLLRPKNSGFLEYWQFIRDAVSHAPSAHGLFVSHKRQKMSYSLPLSADRDLHVRLRRLYGIYPAPQTCEVHQEHVHIAIHPGNGRGHLWPRLNAKGAGRLQCFQKLLLFFRTSLIETLLQACVICFSRTISKAQYVSNLAKSGCVISRDHQFCLWRGYVLAQRSALHIVQNLHVGKHQRSSFEFRQGSGRHDLEFAMVLHQQNQDSSVGRNKIVGIKIARWRREVNSHRIYGLPRSVQRVLVGVDPCHNLPSRRPVIRPCHRVSRRVPEVRPRHRFGRCQVHHGLACVDSLITVP